MHSIPRYPIVDTGPLFDFLLWRFSELVNVPALLSNLRYLKTDIYRRSLEWYFSVAKPITTCPQVIAEIHQHAERMHGIHLGDFWRHAQKELSSLGLSETLVKLLEMDSDTLSLLGPTDTAFLHIAILKLSQIFPRPLIHSMLT